MRLGASLLINEEEEKTIFSGDGKADGVLLQLAKDGRYELDGESYIPEESIADFNRRYGSKHEVGDRELGFDA